MVFGRGKARRRHVMFVFLVEYWNEEYKGDVFEALYAVRARNVDDCTRLLFEVSTNTQTAENQQQKYDLIRAQVLVSKKIRLLQQANGLRGIAEPRLKGSRLTRGLCEVFPTDPRGYHMPVTTSFVFSNATKSFEATAYLSRYTPYDKDEFLYFDKNMSIDGIFENAGGAFQPCPLFQVTLIDEFLQNNNIDLADKELYTLYRSQQQVDRECAEDDCRVHTGCSSMTSIPVITG